MAVVLTKLYGVDHELELKLKARGVKDSEDLIALANKNGGVKTLAPEMGIDAETLSALVNRAHLVRIRGIGEAYTMLLEEAGVKSVSDLATKSPDELRGQLEQINQNHKVVGRVPALAMVNGWVNKAQRVPKA